MAQTININISDSKATDVAELSLSEGAGPPPTSSGIEDSSTQHVAAPPQPFANGEGAFSSVTDATAPAPQVHFANTSSDFDEVPRPDLVHSDLTEVHTDGDPPPPEDAFGEANADETHSNATKKPTSRSKKSK